MTTDASELHPLTPPPWPRSIITPAEYTGGEWVMLAWDLGRVTEAEKKQVIGQWCRTLPTLQHLRGLSLWTHVTQPIFDAACQIGALEALEIKWSNCTRLDAIAALQQLRSLRIGSSTKVSSLAPLAELSALRMLDLENFKSITDFSPLLALTGLRSLAVTGGIWTRQKLSSLDLFGQMAWLDELAVDTSNIKSLRPLAQLTGLKSLGVGGRLPMEEYAWLAAQLPNTECRWFAPYLDLANSGIGRCPRCGERKQVMLTGRGKGVRCLACDAAKVQRHIDAFNTLKAQATP